MSVKDVLNSLNEITQSTDVNTGNQGSFGGNSPYLNRQNVKICSNCGVAVRYNEEDEDITCPVCKKEIEDDSNE